MPGVKHATYKELPIVLPLHPHCKHYIEPYWEKRSKPLENVVKKKSLEGKKLQSDSQKMSFKQFDKIPGETHKIKSEKDKVDIPKKMFEERRKKETIKIKKIKGTNLKIHGSDTDSTQLNTISSTVKKHFSGKYKHLLDGINDVFIHQIYFKYQQYDKNEKKEIFQVDNGLYDTESQNIHLFRCVQNKLPSDIFIHEIVEHFYCSNIEVFNLINKRAKGQKKEYVIDALGDYIKGKTSDCYKEFTRLGFSENERKIVLAFLRNIPHLP